MGRFVIANFKMNKVSHENRKWGERICELIFKLGKPRLSMGCAPSFPYIKIMKEIFTGIDFFIVGAQNVYFKEKGAFTGEISINQLKDIGADFVIVGHSERRHIFGETDELIAKKLEAVLNSNIMAVLCIGETRQERDDGKTYDVLKRQLSIISNISVGSKKLPLDKLIIAYEPVWAIGTGIPATRKDIEDAVNFIRMELGSILEVSGLGVSGKDVPILYGGSIDEDVATEIRDICDGGLVGSASLDPDKFFRISQNFCV